MSTDGYLLKLQIQEQNALMLQGLFLLQIIGKREYFHKTEQKKKNKLRGFSSQANYTDRATAACRRS
jgi:hypothetical protein